MARRGGSLSGACGAFALAAALALPSIPALALPVGEPLASAAAKFGLSDDDIAVLRSSGGELFCPGKGRAGATLNAWLVNSQRQILTNAHGIIELSDDGPRLRQPVQGCLFTSFLDVDRPDRKARAYRLRLGDYKWLFRDGAPAPVDPRDFGSDVVRFRLDRPVADGRTLRFDNSPVSAGDALLLVSRAPIGRGGGKEGQLLVQRCIVKSLDPPSPAFSQGAITSCNAAVGMSGGILVRKENDRLVAKGLLVSVKYTDRPDGSAGAFIGAHHLAIDKKFQSWLKGGCPFWPKGLKVRACGR